MYSDVPGGSTATAKIAWAAAPDPPYARPMSRVERIFEEARAANRRLLMPFLCAGYPAPNTLSRALPAMERAGASIVEIGIPFSDPIADGPVIASAMHHALRQGTTPENTFEEVERIRPSLGLGLVAMVSASIVYRCDGPGGFAARAARAGFDGVIYPDAPLDEAGDFLAAAGEAGLSASLLISPTTPPARARAIAESCTGFVYVLARTGLTGERSEAPDVAERIAALRECTSKPIACGFGISTPDHVRAVVAHADAAIVGSALVKRMGRAAESGADPVETAESFTRELASALSASGAPTGGA
jgi:tryptophan synthase alpha chain